MTTLDRPVWRQCRNAFSGRKRRLCVAIVPGHGDNPDTLAFREHRGRKVYSVTVEGTYLRAVVASVERDRAERRKARKTARGAR